MLHGLALSKEVMLPLFHAPILCDLQLIALDLPGHGHSQALELGVPHTSQRMAESVIGLLISMGLCQIELVVHSVASGLVPYLLSERSVEVRSVTLLEGNLTDEDTEWSQTIANLDHMALTSYVRRFRRIGSVLMRQQLRREVTELELAAYSSGFQLVEQRALHELATSAQVEIAARTVERALAAFVGPKRYVRGEDGRTWGRTQSVVSQLSIPIEFIPGAGHYAMIDEPIATARAIARCIQV
jgi:pimeloyl-ACP methyl ester carboxylesterase